MKRLLIAAGLLAAPASYALAGIGEDVELTEGGDVVEAGIGAGIGDHHQTVPYQDSATIGHFLVPTRNCPMRGNY